MNNITYHVVAWHGKCTQSATHVQQKKKDYSAIFINLKGKRDNNKPNYNKHIHLTTSHLRSTGVLLNKTHRNNIFISFFLFIG